MSKTTALSTIHKHVMGNRLISAVAVFDRRGRMLAQVAVSTTRLLARRAWPSE